MRENGRERFGRYYFGGGVVPNMVQGREQGDEIMRVLFFLEHSSLEAIQARLQVSERVFAFQNDVFTVLNSSFDVFISIKAQFATVVIRVHTQRNRVGRFNGSAGFHSSSSQVGFGPTVWRGNTTIQRHEG